MATDISSSLNKTVNVNLDATGGNCLEVNLSPACRKVYVTVLKSDDATVDAFELSQAGETDGAAMSTNAVPFQAGDHAEVDVVGDVGSKPSLFISASTNSAKAKVKQVSGSNR